MAKRKSTRRERVKKAIRIFEKLAVGLVKIWLNKNGVPTSYIVAIDEVDALIEQELK